MSANQESECVPEGELVELFRPRRADPEEFRRGVERRIEEKRASDAARPAPQNPPTSMWLRRAAAFFPGDPFTGALGGAALGKVAGA
ncbi:MAG TPA: hypothetical protein VK843_01650, partial [Planctomycetota bacterium]|nr:hypothetical protein [Planctomycetota bacterium]